jgi:cobalt-precorrin 5A hydrolase/precorrin-3B C17-methyltransferase
VVAVVCLTPGGEALACRIAGAIGGTAQGRAGRTSLPVTFDDTVAHVRELFAAGVPIIGICATGILIRAVAPLLADKRTEPPVIAVAEDGSAVVPLLGGHRGANRLARRIADVLGVPAAVTTAGDLALGVALDDPPPGWRIDGDVAPVMAGLLAGEPFRLEGGADWLAPLAALPNVTAAPGREAAVLLSRNGGGPALAFHPARYAVGVGCARDCPAGELSALVAECLAAADVPNPAVAGVFSLDLKADEPAVTALAAELGVPARFFDAARLEAETPRLANPSAAVFAEVGCHGVAEAAALAATGPEGRLILPKRKSAMATCAIAAAPDAILDPPGRSRGRLSIVGIGPGATDWRTPEGSRLIAQADELVGYGLYLDLLGPLGAGKPRRDFPLGAEEERCRYALERAGEGRDVALVSSGDAGIYAMAALVWELIADGAVSPAARRVEVVTAPGISALQAAAARIGAPLGHDFCAISLSDLLTPREDILARVRAAAEGDFVVAFYNPVSQRRRELFPLALQIFSRHRPPDTPVTIASNLGRPGERVSVRRLEEVTVGEVDMLTLVIVGSSRSRAFRHAGQTRVFTPRGYAAKREQYDNGRAAGGA